MIDQQTYQRYANDPAKFRADLIVDVSGVARRFGEVADDWQRADFAALDPALLRCTGRKLDGNPLMRAYLERARGHSKTTDLAITCCWLMAFATRPLRGYCFAADKDQARLLRDAMAMLTRLNPWLSSILDVQANRVVNVANGHPGADAQLEIFTSDVGSSYGILPDFVICDELVHWEGDGSLWSSVISSAAKRANCVLVVITNAGFLDSWQWGVREAARNDPAWYFSRLDGPVATWMDQKRLDEQRRMMPLVAFGRLWLNQWSTGGGDALTPQDIEAAFRDDLLPMTGRERDTVFVAGVDLGLTRDGSAIVVLAVPQRSESGRIQLAHHKLWLPTPGNKVDLLEVERHLRAIDDRYHLAAVGFDPWQMEHLAQRLEQDSQHRRRAALPFHSKKPWMREIPPTASNLRDIASRVIESFTDRRLQLFPCEPLRRDLLKLRVEEKSYGIRLTSPRDEHGHGDSASAFGLALLLAHEFAGKKQVHVGPLFQPRRTPVATWQARQAAYEAEMRKLSDGSDDTQERLREILSGSVETFDPTR